jgi:hypothetical protein
LISAAAQVRAVDALCEEGRYFVCRVRERTVLCCRATTPTRSSRRSAARECERFEWKRSVQYERPSARAPDAARVDLARVFPADAVTGTRLPDETARGVSMPCAAHYGGPSFIRLNLRYCEELRLLANTFRGPRKCHVPASVGFQRGKEPPGRSAASGRALCLLHSTRWPHPIQNGAQRVSAKPPPTTPRLFPPKARCGMQ